MTKQTSMNSSFYCKWC